VVKVALVGLPGIRPTHLGFLDQRKLRASWRLQAAPKDLPNNQDVSPVAWIQQLVAARASDRSLASWPGTDTPTFAAVRAHINRYGEATTPASSHLLDVFNRAELSPGRNPGLEDRPRYWGSRGTSSGAMNGPALVNGSYCDHWGRFRRADGRPFTVPRRKSSKTWFASSKSASTGATG
jgi:hypothetical protein